ncbi:hypothetical protein PR202_gb23423 [Eleusine coracana subsp. coracana]|uniref:Ubiquitin-like protease family profile domain-containing protein n=1 Tax=Eleusine coracana subsp. coracana TaxID=191504 RepID=A0AAV5FIX3_ELECO|nr:hypothetical protein PR202_gb23423 [Eleusine coracana subsp. coracana]
MTTIDDEIDGIKAYIPRLRIARWPKRFKSVPIEKYDGQTNPREWLQLYSTAIRSAGGDSYVMVNYLPVCLDPAVRIWLTSLSEESITSWGDHWICLMIFPKEGYLLALDSLDFNKKLYNDILEVIDW